MEASDSSELSSVVITIGGVVEARDRLRDVLRCGEAPCFGMVRAPLVNKLVVN